MTHVRSIPDFSRPLPPREAAQRHEPISRYLTRPADASAPLAQIVRLGDLGDFRTAIPRPRAAREEAPVTPLTEPETAPVPERKAGNEEGFDTSIARPREEAPAEVEASQDEPAPVATAEVRQLFPHLPWGGAGNVVAAAGCAVLALVGMRA